MQSRWVLEQLVRDLTAEVVGRVEILRVAAREVEVEVESVWVLLAGEVKALSAAMDFLAVEVRALLEEGFSAGEVTGLSQEGFSAVSLSEALAGSSFVAP